MDAEGVAGLAIGLGVVGIAVAIAARGSGCPPWFEVAQKGNTRLNFGVRYNNGVPEYAGLLTSDTGQPIANAKIEFIDTATGTSYDSAMTNASGFFGKSRPFQSDELHGYCMQAVFHGSGFLVGVLDKAVTGPWWVQP